METGKFQSWKVRMWAVLCILCLLGISVSPAQSASAWEATHNLISTQMDLDEDVSEWGIFEEKGNPISEISNEASPSLDGLSLRCAILGGDFYSNVHCYRNLPQEPNSNLFLMSLSFYYRPQTTFNNAGGVPSIVQGLEFTMNKWQNGMRYEWALQWDNVDPTAPVSAPAPKWRYWNPALPDPYKWVDAGLASGVSGVNWHTLILEGGIFNGEVHYRRFILDNTIIPLDKVVASAPAPGEPDKLAVAVQLDGNYRADPYEVFIDDVTLITAESFYDVPFRYWAFDWIQRLYAANITGGCDVGPLRYCPESTVTRAQMAVFLERGIHSASYVPPTVGSSTGFTDVPPNYWAAAWIKQLAADGITGGCGSANYCPESPVTRAQMAVFLLRSKHGADYNPPTVGNGTGFGDVPTTHWAAPWIKQLVAEGITTGCGANMYCPEAPVTRAQMAVFLVRTFNLS